ncbi:MAG: DNA-binding protein WhiA [Malacoplasma sp.]|nr:DNA-binding protein WhiA [Malacoplasma sp.]
MTSTFSEKIKQEITHLEYNDLDLESLVFAFLINRLKINLTNEKQEWILESNFSFIARFIGDSIRRLFNVAVHYSYSAINKFNNMRTYRIMIDDPNFVNVVEKANHFYELMNTKIQQQDQMVKRAFLSGAFLSGGSVGGIDKSIYHLEIRSSKADYLRILQKILMDFKLSPTILKRKYGYVLYIKRSFEISDFLKLIGAMNAMFELEDKIATRDYNNNLHRMNNLDMANMEKTARSGTEQIAMIKKVIKTDKFKKTPLKFQYFCQLRLKFPTLSLSGLQEKYYNIYKIKVTRTGLNHYVIKLKEMTK